MAAATDAQVQNFVDQRIRVRCEQIRALFARLEDDLASFGDVLLNVNGVLPTWADSRTDSPPALMTIVDIKKFKRVADDLIALKTTGSISDEWPSIISSCVRPLHVVVSGPG
jgi:hypothetical protein